MPPYARPAIAAPPVLDHDGAPIPYGERWGWDGPPEEAYSVDAHPERFAPLHAVADALVAHLLSTYDVFAESVDGATLLPGSARVVLRAVRLRPACDDAAGLTIGWTVYPSVIVRAGADARAVAPVCGCEACDETWDRAADELERFVLAVADGRLQESLDDDRVGVAVEAPEGSSSGWTIEHDAARRAEIGAILDARQGVRWRSWPLRGEERSGG
ncbi:DUF6226 family protein [Agrococcus sp. SGAir0287]|uniref:DUF6226 family protein n=1 Tax=Agrococcus sp. SGAir0287 TaxID=2070347 RepID=UPI0010F7EB51|nr:DUF6226 family protein [Agrococcus sp. SGAir0287]